MSDLDRASHGGCAWALLVETLGTVLLGVLFEGGRSVILELNPAPATSNEPNAHSTKYLLQRLADPLTSPSGTVHTKDSDSTHLQFHAPQWQVVPYGQHVLPKSVAQQLSVGEHTSSPQVPVIRSARVPGADACLTRAVGLRARGTLESMVHITLAVASAIVCVQRATRAATDGALAAVLTIATWGPLPTRTLTSVVLRGFVKDHSLLCVAHEMQYVGEFHELVTDGRAAICHVPAGQEILEIPRIHIVSAPLGGDLLSIPSNGHTLQCGLRLTFRCCRAVRHVGAERVVQARKPLHRLARV